MNGHTDIVKILINKFDINAADKELYFIKFQLFLDSIKSDFDEEIDEKFKIGFLEMKDKNSWSPLHHACCYGRVGLVKLLLNNHCKIDSITNDGNQPIHLACENGHIDIVKILIDNKCDINASSEDCSQPIHMASGGGHIDIVKILIDNKCDINASDNDGLKPIHFASANGHIGVLKILVDNKCDINASDNWEEYQPIHWASLFGEIDIVKTLIASKCDINAVFQDGSQAMHLACWYGYTDIVKLLIANKCDIDVSDKIYGYQPIHFACRNGHLDIMKILIKDDWFMNESSKRLLISAAMDLQCKVDCDHVFCRKSLEDEVFKNGEFIGSGAFGEVYKYKKPNTDHAFVIKRTQFNCDNTEDIEGNINKYFLQIAHKNIVRYFGALEKSEKLSIYMEYMPGGSLKDLIVKSNWIENLKVVKFSKQILEGLEFIHSEGIIHRDIKPENMLLDHDETLKLTDFGWSKSLRSVSIEETTIKADMLLDHDETLKLTELDLSKSLCHISIDKSTIKTKRRCGTANYMAPEVILGEPYDFRADIWSTGASIIYMITGKIPHYPFRYPAVVYKIKTTKKIEFTPCEPIPETMQSFIHDSLEPEQANRPNAKDLLKHSFFD